MRRLSILSIQNRQLRINLDKAASEKPTFDQVLKEWAVDHGFPTDEVDKRLKAWADDVLARKQETSLEEQAEAELALRHYDSAVALFRLVLKNEKEAHKKRQENYLEGLREDLRKTLQTEMSDCGNVEQFGRHFHEATESIDDARSEASEDHERYPKDPTIRMLWLWISLVAEGTRVKEGEMSLSQEDPGVSGAQLFATVTANCHSLLNELDKSTAPEEWAYTQFFLAGGILYQSEISDTHKARDLRAQAVATIQAALSAKIRPKILRAGPSLSRCMLCFWGSSGSRCNRWRTQFHSGF